jgi:catechol 2,3-dioxygenase-like lactoylglutathione lyase family enzyme
MNTISFPIGFISRVTIFLVSLASLQTVTRLQAADSPGEFSKPVIDLGMVVKDADRSAAFLTNAIGFKEVKGFSVSGDLGRKIGLIDGHPVDVRMFILEETEPATRIKVLSFVQAQGKPADQSFIHSTLGFRYLTIYVKDMNRALERLKKAQVALLGESPVDLGGGTFLVTFKDPDGNFIELIGPRR